MKTILIFNVGSSSLKYAVYKSDECVLKGNHERITSTNLRKEAVHKILEDITRHDLHPDCIGHRVVHGKSLSKTSLITADVREKIKEASKLAPIHNIPQLEVIDICQDVFGLDQYAVFDTAFHQTIPKKTHMYAIPKELYEKGIRKYGFHGISHEFVSQGFGGKVITAHLGSGCSISAIKDGESIQTSLGFTPLGGVMMGTRPGPLDASIITYLQKEHNYSVDDVESMLSKDCGLKAISGLSDMRDVEDILETNEDAKLAIEMFILGVVEQIGAYAAHLNGVDTLIFTAGVGENGSMIRERICASLTYLGLEIDAKANAGRIKEKRKISTANSKVDVYVIPTNEELAIVQKIERLLE